MTVLSTFYPDLRSANVARQALWDAGHKLTLTYRANEMAGEVGEACNIAKKIERERLGMQGSRATKGDLAMELADVVICADLVALSEGIDLDRAVADKFNSTSMTQGFPIRLSAPGGLPQDVIDLVIAARVVAFEDPSPEAIKALDKASEAFASRVPWDDEPEDAAETCHYCKGNCTIKGLPCHHCNGGGTVR